MCRVSTSDIWLGEVDIAFEFTGDATVVGVFAAVVEGDGLDRGGQRLHHLDDGIGSCAFRLALDRATCHEARLAFHEGDDRTPVIAPTSVGTVDGVAFAVAKGLTGIDVSGSLVDIDAVWNQMSCTATLAWTPTFVILA